MIFNYLISSSRVFDKYVNREKITRLGYCYQHSSLAHCCNFYGSNLSFLFIKTDNEIFDKSSRIDEQSREEKFKSEVRKISSNFYYYLILL